MLTKGIVQEIINQTSKRMKDFLRLFGVDKSPISPFCKKFENANEIRNEFMLYCPSGKDFSDDIGEKIVDKKKNVMRRTCQMLKLSNPLISKVQINITNVINDDEIIEDEHGTEVDEIESNSSSTEFYNAVDGSIAIKSFNSVNHARILNLSPS